MSSTQCQAPSTAGVERTFRARSTMARWAGSATGWLSSAVTGWPTPYAPALGPKATSRVFFALGMPVSKVRTLRPGAPSPSSVLTRTV